MTATWGSDPELIRRALGVRSLSSLARVAAPSPATASPAGGYWLYTAYGNVYNVGGAGFQGSPASKRERVRSVVGMAATPDGRGYCLVTSQGRIYAFGDAPGHRRRIRHAHPIIGIVASDGHGYWLYTAYGNVYNVGGARFHGSPASRRIGVSDIGGMIATPSRRGYWLGSSDGRVFRFGAAAPFEHPVPSGPVAELSGP